VHSDLSARQSFRNNRYRARADPCVPYPDNLQLEFFVHVSSDEKTAELTEADSAQTRRLLATAESALKGEASTGVRADGDVVEFRFNV
jgi:hypothetical protein